MKCDHRSSAGAQRGFGAIMAIVVLVILASLAAGMTTLGTTQQLSSAQDVLSARAFAAARSGIQVGLFKALSSTTPADAWKACNGLVLPLDMSVTTGFHVMVSCNSATYNEGESAPGMPIVVRVYSIVATACNSSSACPDATMATSPTYIERVLEVTATN